MVLPPTTRGAIYGGLGTRFGGPRVGPLLRAESWSCHRLLLFFLLADGYFLPVQVDIVKRSLEVSGVSEGFERWERFRSGLYNDGVVYGGKALHSMRGGAAARVEGACTWRILRGANEGGGLNCVWLAR